METYTVKEIVELLDTNPETVRRWIRNGKLSYIKGNSKKEGNLVTKSMLEAFLKSSPKYSSLATSLLSSPIALTATAATVLGGVLAKQVVENENIKNAMVGTSDIVRLLEDNIRQYEESIKLKRESIVQLEKEVAIEISKITETKKLIYELKK